MPVRGKNGGNAGNGSKWITRKRRLAIYARDDWKCVWCNMGVWSHHTAPADSERMPNLMVTLDHILPRDAGGTNETRNLLTSCMRCNRERGTRNAYSFASYLWVAGRGTAAARTLWRVVRAVLRPLPVVQPLAPNERGKIRTA